jgi:hypothetical protein
MKAVFANSVVAWIVGELLHLANSRPPILQRERQFIRPFSRSYWFICWSCDRASRRRERRLILEEVPF